MPLRLTAPLAFLLVLLGTAAQAQGTPPAAPPGADPLAVVGRFVEGFNRHDLSLMIAETDADVKWLTVVDDRVIPDARGQAALQEWLAKFLSVYPSVKKTVEQSIVHAPFVSVWERSRWTGKSGNELTQAVLVVYEVQKDKIKNVWRYSPQK